jgi:hypothetical protein
LLAFTAGAKPFARLQAIAKAGNSPLRPAVRGEQVERFSNFRRVDVVRLAVDCGGFE